MNTNKKQLGADFADLIIGCSCIMLKELPIGEARGIVLPCCSRDSSKIGFERKIFEIPDDRLDRIEIHLVIEILESNVEDVRFNIKKIQSLFDISLLTHFKCESGEVVMSGMYKDQMIRLTLRTK